MNLHDIFESKAFHKQDVVRADDKPQIVPPERDGSSPHPYQGRLVGEEDDTLDTKQHPAGEGKKMSKRTKEQIMAEMAVIKNKLAEAEPGLDAETALRRARDITKGIKYDDTATDIIVQIQTLAEHVPGIDMSTLEYHVKQVHEAKSALDSAVYGLEEAFEYLAHQELDKEDLGETSIDSDRMRSFIVFDKSSGKILQIDVSPRDLPLVVAQHQRSGYDAGYKRQNSNHYTGGIIGESKERKIDHDHYRKMQQKQTKAAQKADKQSSKKMPGLNEISKDLALSYNKAAADDVSDHSYKNSDGRYDRRLANREKGMNLAVKKLGWGNPKVRATEAEDTKVKSAKDNFTPADLKELEGLMRDLPAMKARALELVQHKGPRSLKPEKVVWFTNAIQTKESPMAIIKLMYDLLLAGEGFGTIGTKHSMKANSYRDRFSKNK